MKHEVRGFRGIDPVILARFRAFLQKKYGKVNGLQGQYVTEALEQWLDRQTVVGVESVEETKLSKRTMKNLDLIRRLIVSELNLTPTTTPTYIQQIVITSYIWKVISDYRYRRKYVGLLISLGYIEPDIRDGIPVYKLNHEWLFPEKPKEVKVVE
jgi:hypothetical protein